MSDTITGPVTNRHLHDLGVPETTLRTIRERAQEGLHYLRNPEFNGRIEWTEAGCELLLSSGELAPLQEALNKALKKTAPQPPEPALCVLVAVRRGQNPVIVQARKKDAPDAAPLVRCRVHPEVEIRAGLLLNAKAIPGYADLFEIVGKPYRARV